MAFAETAELAVRINLEGNASAGLQKLQGQVSGLGKSLGRAGKGVGQIGAGFARAGLVVGGAALAGLTGAAKAAIDFEDAFAGVRKTVDEADLIAAGTSFAELERTFRDMATEIPIAATEFARLGETAGALGVKADSIDEFVRTTALLGVTTDLTADAAADALGRIGTILGFTGDDYEEFADSLVALGNAGASTESEIVEISKRFAAEGKAAGLAKEDIAGLASATASLGFAPERGGTALSRVFANMGTNISLANKKGKAFADITGRSISDLQDSLDKGEGLGIFLDVLKGIKGLSPTDANRVLKSLGITNTSDRTIFRAMAANLPFVNEQLELAGEATGALSEEATKRFNTIASKLALLKNNFIEAGITIGTAMLPALGRATESLTEFLKDPTSKRELEQLGEDIGEAIDDIDWADVLRDARSFVGVLKGALAFVLDIISAVNKLPTEIKAAAAGLLVLNKASGGLIGAGIGNVAGGLAGAITQGLAARAPGVGRLFAQPVFVTNWPPGMGIGGLGGGAGAAAAGAGAIGAGLAVTAIVAAVATTVLSTLPFADRNNAQAKAGLNKAEIAAVNYYAADKVTQQNIFKRLGYVPDRADADSGNAKLNEKLTALKDQANRTKDDTIAATNKVKIAATETKREAGRGLALVNSSTRSGSAAIVSAVYANRPIITTNVSVSATTVKKTVTVNERYGPSGGSRNYDSGDDNIRGGAS